MPADRSSPQLTRRQPDDERTALQKIAAMSPAQRLALAMKGTREERAILVRDPNRIVAVAVLSSPKISEAEVESIAKMANVSDEILRIIGHTRVWLKKYSIVSALAKNPKTPLGVSSDPAAKTARTRGQSAVHGSERPRNAAACGAEEARRREK